jgi:hypothetical protein
LIIHFKYKEDIKERRGTTEHLGTHGHRGAQRNTGTFLKFNGYFTSAVQQPYGYNVTGQLQELNDLIRPAAAKIVFTIL